MKNENTKAFVPIRAASALTGIGQQTLRRLYDENVIKGYSTPSGQRMYNITSIQEFCGIANLDQERTGKANFLYARVSSRKQSDDLVRQVEYLRGFRPEYHDYTLVQDIGSGINFKRKGLLEILDRCSQRAIGEVVVAHKDRLSRFGFDLIKIVIEKAGGKLTVIENPHTESSEQELAEDLLSIVHIYSCRQMGKRSYTKRKTSSNENILSETIPDPKPEGSD